MFLKFPKDPLVLGTVLIAYIGIFQVIIPVSGAFEVSNQTDIKGDALAIDVMPPFLPPMPPKDLTIIELILLNQLEERIASRLVAGNKNHSSSYITLPRLNNWLIASGWNVDQAEKAYLKSMNWREKKQVDRLANEPVSEDMLNHFYFNVGGHDKEGCPLLTMPLGDWRTPRSFLEKTKSSVVSGDKLRNHFIQMLETVKIYMKRQESPCYQFVLICDLDGFTALHSAGAHSFRWFVETLVQNYPNSLKLAYFINSPPSFIKMVERLKPTLGSNFVSKMYIYTDKMNWEPALLQNINSDQLSARYGGQKYFLH